MTERKENRIMAFDSARSMKRILRFLVGLLINVCILFVLVKAFTYSFDFAYQVFATKAVNAGDTSKVAVELVPDASLLEVADTLYDAGVIENKYAFILKLRISGGATKVVSGTYELSPSNTNVEIINTITGGDSKDSSSSDGTDADNTGREMDESEITESASDDTGDAADDATDDTEDITDTE